MVERTTNQFLLRLQKAITNYEKTDLPAANTGLAKVAFQCSADRFVVNQSLVLRINICGENRHLRQARNRYGQA
jgi:hypothetical protein